MACETILESVEMHGQLTICLSHYQIETKSKLHYIQKVSDAPESSWKNYYVHTYYNYHVFMVVVNLPTMGHLY